MDAVHICGVCLMDVFVHYERKINRELRPRSDASACTRLLRKTEKNICLSDCTPPRRQVTERAEKSG